MVKCRRMKRPQFMSKSWIYFANENPRKHASSIVARKALRWTRTLIWNGSTVKNHVSFKTVFEYSVIRKTSWFLVYQRVPPQARLPQRPWHLQRRLIIQITLQQSCQVKVWKGKYGETRILLKHQKSGWINQRTPKTKWKCESRASTERPVLFRHTGMVARIQRESCGWQSSWTQRLTREFFSWIIFRACGKCEFG